jgi:crotonobetainyl-CoA:carnitine CoA-transferase CaiB-like acyl-CoA transferase
LTTAAEHPSDHRADPTAALAGVRVLDFGADVIKIERPGGDSTRTMGWTLPDDTDSLFWKLVNRGKRTLTLDLTTTEGRAAALALIDDADVIIENMRPGRLEKLGMAPALLLERNPRLVIVRVTGFGQTGPYSQRPGFATIAEAMSGYADLTGEPDGGPLLPPIALTDEVTALVAAFSAMVALRHAESTGRGQVVDVSLLESMLQIMGPLPAAWAQLGYLQPRLGSGMPFTTPRGTYRCADGVWVALSASAESVAARVLGLLGLPDDDRFRSFQGRFENREALEEYTRAWIGGRESAEVIERFEQVDAAITTVYTMADIAGDKHVQAREALIEVDGVTMQNVVAKLSETPGAVRWAGPAAAPAPATDCAAVQFHPRSQSGA